MPAPLPPGMLSRLRRAAARRWHLLNPLDPDRFLRQCRGIIHVGANDGEERVLYADRGLEVLWVEALPEVFRQLQTNLAGYPKQWAVQALLSDRDGEERDFHVADNGGQSSSLFEFARHVEIWPEVNFSSTLRLTTSTLDTLVARAPRLPAQIDGLVLDTQGAELLVLRGARRLLPQLRYIKAEASDFEAYAGACDKQTLVSALRGWGFEPLREHRFAAKEGVGAYYDVVFGRAS